MRKFIPEIFTLLLVLFVGTASADVHVYKDNVEAFCAATQVDATHFAGNCATTPPPNDPTALTFTQIRYSDHGVYRPVNNVDVRTNFGGIVGRISNVPTFNGVFPYLSGPTWAVTLPANKIIRDRIDVLPGTPTNISRSLVAVSYGPSPNDAAHSVRVAIVPVGGAWPTGPDTGCFKSHQRFMDQTLLTTTTNPADANPYRCKLIPGQSYEILFGYDIPSSQGNVVFWWH